jgi:AbrB family looped-hinge helix DNA binding protein
MSKIKRLTLRSRVGPRGQLVIPQPLRDALGIAPNSYLLLSLEDDRIVVEKKDPVETLEEFISTVPEKRAMPEKIDWDREYYEQLE